MANRGVFGHPGRFRGRYQEASQYYRSVIIAAGVIEPVELRRFTTTPARQPPRPAFSWVLGPQIAEVPFEPRVFTVGSERFKQRKYPEASKSWSPQIIEDLTVDLRRFVQGQDRGRPRYAEASRAWAPQVREELTPDLRRFVTGPARVRWEFTEASRTWSPQIIEDLTAELRRFVTGPPDRHQRAYTYDSRVWSPQIAESIIELPVELRRLVSGADRLRDRFSEASRAWSPQVIEDFTVELRHFVLGADRHRPRYAEASAVVSPITPEVEEFIRGFVIGSARQAGIRVEASQSWRSILEVVLVDLPVELRRFVVGQARQPRIVDLVSNAIFSLGPRIDEVPPVQQEAIYIPTFRRRRR